MMLNGIAKSVTRNPWIYIFIYLGLTALAATQLPSAEIDPDTKSQLPEDLASRVNLQKIEELFGATDMVMLVMSADDVLEVDALSRVKKLSKETEKVAGLDRIISLFTMKTIRVEDDQMVVDPAIRRIPKTAAERAQLRKELEKNELVYGNILSKDCKHTAIIGFLDFDAKDEEVHSKLKSIIDNTPGPGEILIGGMPLTRLQLSRDIRGDMRSFLPFGLLLMLVFLFLCFRQLRGVILPFAMTVMAIIFAMGLLAFLGWKIHVVTVIMPVILIAVANDYSIHLVARYQEENRPGNRKTSKELALSGILEIGKPTLAAGITTIAGLLCLLTHIIIPARQLGVLAAAGVGFAVTGSLLFVPAVMSLLPKGKQILGDLQDRKKGLSLFDRLLSQTALLVVKRPKMILAVLLSASVIIATGIPSVEIDANPNNFYSKEKPIRRATDLLNEHFGGWAAVSVVTEGDVK
ncbi:MAG: MMPL family transporter, partial [Proteobacteria bacterium]|nr:MMPL family transporter [Pseudomonadota bacterium]